MLDPDPVTFFTCVPVLIKRSEFHYLYYQWFKTDVTEVKIIHSLFQQTIICSELSKTEICFNCANNRKYLLICSNLFLKLKQLGKIKKRKNKMFNRTFKIMQVQIINSIYFYIKAYFACYIKKNFQFIRKSMIYLIITSVT